MRFLANEKLPVGRGGGAARRRTDVAWVRTDAPGSSDPEVLQRASAEQRILLTQDKDFGELAFRSGLPAACGIVLFRLGAPSSAVLAQWVQEAIAAREVWAGQFAVVEPGRIRVRSLPTGP